MPRTVLSPADIAGIAARAEPIAYRYPKSGVENGFYYVESISDEEARLKGEWEKLFNARVLELARDICVRISSDYSVRAMEGKLGSIRSNRNNWKADAAGECVAEIDSLIQSMSKQS